MKIFTRRRKGRGLKRVSRDENITRKQIKRAYHKIYHKILNKIVETWGKPKKERNCDRSR